jgi:hypothetical protein
MTHLHWNLYSGFYRIANSIQHSGLRYTRSIGGNGFHFAVKVDFEGQSRSVKHRAAVLAIAEVSLDFPADFRREPTFQILTD